MKISLDIDNTMYNLNVIEQVSKLLGLNYKSEDVLHWVYNKKEINGFPKYFTDLVFAHFDDPAYMGNLEIYDGVQDKLTTWKNEGHELYAISARKPSVYIATINMLNKDLSYDYYNVDKHKICHMKTVFESIHFVEHKTDAKIKLYKELGIDVTIDDNPIDIRKSCELGLKVFAIKNKVTKYNYTSVNECINIFDNCKAVEGIKDIDL